MPTAHACPVCDESDVFSFFEASDMPVHVGLQWPSRDAAQTCPKGDLTLQFCRTCGHIYNAAFDPGRMEYTEAYDNSLHFSPRFQEYSHEVASHLIDRYNLRERDVVEIGCGKGEFLTLLAQRGNNRGVGFDPSYEPERRMAPAGVSNGPDASTAGDLTFIQDFYSEAYSDYRADLICSRYVFEHIAEPVPFLQTVRRTIERSTDTVVYFEVPNVFLILEQLSIWDIIYEHCSYFSPSSLASVFERCGFDVLDLYDGYDGQFLGIEARLRSERNGTDTGSGWTLPPEHTPAAMEGAVRAFGATFEQTRTTWTHRLTEAQADPDRRVVLWGAGAKAVGFLNMLGLSADTVPYVVDINPHKAGHYMAGTGQEIVAPPFLSTYQPDTIIVMNPIYRAEIETTASELGVSATFWNAS